MPISYNDVQGNVETRMILDTESSNKRGRKNSKDIRKIAIVLLILSICFLVAAIYLFKKTAEEKQEIRQIQEITRCLKHTNDSISHIPHAPSP